MFIAEGGQPRAPTLMKADAGIHSLLLNTRYINNQHHYTSSLLLM